jgi:hypothetical protein
MNVAFDPLGPGSVTFAIAAIISGLTFLGFSAVIGYLYRIEIALGKSNQ